MRTFLLLFCLLTAVLPMGPVAAAEDPARVSARSAALELAGAFTANDGYKLRDGFLVGDLKTGDSRIVAVNLYAGNHYWFCSADPSGSTREIALLVFDESGQPVPILTYSAPGRGAAGFTPADSGLHYVKITAGKGDTTPICFLYTYK